MILLAQSTAIFAPKLAKINENEAVFEAIDGSAMSERTLEGKPDESINRNSSIKEFSLGLLFRIRLWAMGLELLPLIIRSNASRFWRRESAEKAPNPRSRLNEMVPTGKILYPQSTSLIPENAATEQLSVVQSRSRSQHNTS